MAPVLARGAGAAKEESPAKSDLSRSIEIRIETSRLQPTVGSGLGIQAEFLNESGRTIYLTESKVALILPPELQGPFSSISSWWGMFPTQHTFKGKDPSGQSTEENYEGVVTLTPGSSYRIIWSTGPDITAAEGPLGFIKNMFFAMTSELNFVFFSPGDYKIAVVAQYWTSPDLRVSEYQTATQAATVRVGAPQSVILFGSALGGLIAYFILPRTSVARRRRLTRDKDAFSSVYLLVDVSSIVLRGLAAAVGAMLLSAIVTILLARISDTQFLVRIAIADFWSAIAVGFVANYVGLKVFEKILGLKQDHGGGETQAGQRVATKTAPVAEEAARAAPPEDRARS
jgi:hypothetical protein